MNVETILHNMVALGATWILWCLMGLSVLAFAVIIDRLVFFASTRADQESLEREVERALSSGSASRLRQSLESNSSIEARIVFAGTFATHPAEAEELMAGEACRQRLRSERYLAFLGTLGNNAPFVGLLGTVIGIMGAFGQLNASGGQLTTGLMAEIGEALVATAVGLLVALPAVATYNSFQRLVSVRLSRGEALGRRIVAALHLRPLVRERRDRTDSDVRDVVGAAG